MSLSLAAAFFAGLGTGLLASVLFTSPRRRRWRDLPPFITRD